VNTTFYLQSISLSTSPAGNLQQMKGSFTEQLLNWHTSSSHPQTKCRHTENNRAPRHSSKSLDGYSTNCTSHAVADP
jgi:hypothetical protein